MSIEERLFSKVIKQDNGCWEFQGFRDGGGYGKIRFNGPMISVHRLSWLLYRGEIPIGIKVLHTCDNPPCCNPEHLFLGTQQDNIDDMWQKGRAHDRSGANNSRAMITEEDAKDILRLLKEGQTQVYIAWKYKIAQTTVSSIKLGKSWPNLERT